jgi:hypothetical protein
MGGKLCLLVQNKFCLMLYDRWSSWVGNSPKMRGRTQLLPCPRPLILRMAPP